MLFKLLLNRSDKGPSVFLRDLGINLVSKYFLWLVMDSSLLLIVSFYVCMTHLLFLCLPPSYYVTLKYCNCAIIFSVQTKSFNICLDT